MRIQRNEQPVFTLPIIGKIKTGYKHPEKGYPIATDYFIPQGRYEKMFTEAYGEKPDCIKILFHTDDLDTVCNERYQIRDDAGKLIAESDGTSFSVWDKAVGKYTHQEPENPPKYMEQIAAKLKQEWKEVLTINFMIPAVKGIGGLWSLTTKGKETSLKNIRDSFDSVKQIAGTVVNIPFDLCVCRHRSNSPSGKSYTVISLTANLSTGSMLEVSKMIAETNNVVNLLKQGELTEEKIKKLTDGKSE